MSADAPKSRMPRTIPTRALAVTALLGVLAAAVLWAQGSSGRAFLRSSHISEPPTGYVQLYFHDPRSLPDYVVSARAHQHLSFVLVNNEQRSRTLHWTISTQGYSPAARGQVRLAPGHSRVVRRTITVRCTRHRVYETVDLGSPSESIGYWISCPSSAIGGTDMHRNANRSDGLAAAAPPRGRSSHSSQTPSLRSIGAARRSATGRSLPASRARADVRVYTMRWWQSDADEVELDGVRYRAICPYLPLYSGERRSIRQAVGFALSCLRLMRGRVDAIEADHMPYIQLFVLRIVAWSRGVPLVVTWHEAWDRAQWRGYLGPAGLRRLGDRAGRHAPARPDRRRVPGDRRRGPSCRLRTGSRSIVAPNGIDAGVDPRRRCRARSGSTS